MHFRRSGTLVWYAVETTLKNDVIVYLLCSINYEIKNIKGFHLTHLRKFKAACGTKTLADTSGQYDVKNI